VAGPLRVHAGRCCDPSFGRRVWIAGSVPANGSDDKRVISGRVPGGTQKAPAIRSPGPSSLEGSHGHVIRRNCSTGSIGWQMRGMPGHAAAGYTGSAAPCRRREVVPPGALVAGPVRSLRSRPPGLCDSTSTRPATPGGAAPEPLRRPAFGRSPIIATTGLCGFLHLRNNSSSMPASDIRRDGHLATKKL